MFTKQLLEQGTNNCLVLLVATTKLLLAGGVSYVKGAPVFLNSVEVINLDETKPTQVCNNLANLPTTLYLASGKLYQGLPTICGGATSNSLATDQCQNCRGFVNSAWTAQPNMTTCRYAPNSVVMNNGSVQSLWMIGTGQT